MKRSVLFLSAVILLGLGLHSCDREDNNGGNNESGTTSVKWVDLGLPSGLLWADRNVGAQNPEDYGNYYAWGETVPKEVYDWINYVYSDNNGRFTKYCTVSDYGQNGFTDYLTTLEASDDAATVNLGDKARMPSDDEWQELIDNTTSTWTTRNGVYGRLLTASNGKSLFLPAAGFRYDSTPDPAGEYGHYWSSKLYVRDPNDAWGFYFYYGNQDMGSYYRGRGLSVRAVRTR